ILTPFFFVFGAKPLLFFYAVLSLFVLSFFSPTGEKIISQSHRLYFPRSPIQYLRSACRRTENIFRGSRRHWQARVEKCLVSFALLFCYLFAFSFPFLSVLFFS